jgi:Fic family protein
MSHRRLAHASFLPERDRDFDARSVLANIRAMEAAIALGASRRQISSDDIREIHRTLLTHPRDKHRAGVLRSSQNWIGKGDTPRDADFIPPPEEYVQPLLDDLASFLGRDDLPAVLQAAVAHSQFETIHPFEDGNGRVGRCLIHVVLRRRGVAERYVPPISLVLAANADVYVNGLTSYREGDIGGWCRTFAWATSSASNGAREFAARVEKLQAAWAVRARSPRVGSAIMKLIAALPGQPIMDIKHAAAITGTSEEGARLALHALAAIDVLRVIEVSKRKRAWESPELFELVNAFERHVATPEGRTGRARPSPRYT